MQTGEPVLDWWQWWADAARADSLAHAASANGFVLTTRDMDRLGISRGRARWAVEQGRWASAGRGRVAPIDVRTDLPEIGADHVLARRRHALLTAGAVLARPSSVACGRSAAIMHGLPTLSVPQVPEANPRQPDFLGPRHANLLRVAALDVDQVSSWFGIGVCDVARSLTDLGRVDRRDAIMAADAALRADLVGSDAVDSALQLASGWPGVRQARAVLALTDRRAESPLESLVRLAVHDAGLPAPDLQVWIGRDRVDFYWPDRRFALEADGRVKYTADERWAEKTREQRIRRHDVRVERVTWRDVLYDWSRTHQMLQRALT